MHFIAAIIQLPLLATMLQLSFVEGLKVNLKVLDPSTYSKVYGRHRFAQDFQQGNTRVALLIMGKKCMCISVDFDSPGGSTAVTRTSSVFSKAIFDDS